MIYYTVDMQRKAKDPMRPVRYMANVSRSMTWRPMTLDFAGQQGKGDNVCLMWPSNL